MIYFFSNLAEVDTEELEKELDSLLLDSAKEPVDLPPVPQKPLLPSISDSELEAELEKEAGGMYQHQQTVLAAGLLLG